MSDMNVIDQLVHTTIRIETSGPTGKGSGTGFFLNLCNTGTSTVPVIVTNKHVIKDASSATFQFTKADLEKNEPIVGELIERVVTPHDSAWIFHPDPEIDLCVFPLAPILEASNAEQRPIYFRAFGVNDIATDEYMGDLVAIEDVLMIGYPSGLWDSKNNFPIVRRGVTATPPGFRFEGRSEFVIDCACFPGSSGSPVLLFNPLSYFDKKSGNMTMGSGRVKLLGVLWAGPQFDSVGEVKVVPIPTSSKVVSHAKIPMNLGYCLRASQLLWFETQLKEVEEHRGANK